MRLRLLLAALVGATLVTVVLLARHSPLGAVHPQSGDSGKSAPNPPSANADRIK